MYEALFTKPEIVEALQKMLDLLEVQWADGRLSDEDYLRVLNSFRFKIGEELYERYHAPGGSIEAHGRGQGPPPHGLGREAVHRQVP